MVQVVVAIFTRFVPKDFVRHCFVGELSLVVRGRKVAPVAHRDSCISRQYDVRVDISSRDQLNVNDLRITSLNCTAINTSTVAVQILIFNDFNDEIYKLCVLMISNFSIPENKL